MKVLVISAALLALTVAQAPGPEWRPSGRLLLLPAHLEYPPPAEYPATTPHPNTTQDSSDESQSERLLDSGEYYVLLPDGRLQMVKYTTAALKEESKKEASSENNQAASNFQQQQNAQNYNFQQVQEQQKAPQYQNQYPDGSSNFQQFQQQNLQETRYPDFHQFQLVQQQQETSQKQNSQYRNPFPEGSSNFQQFQNQPQQVKQVEPAPVAQFQIQYVQFPLPGSQYTQTKLQYTAEDQESRSAQSKAEEKKEDSEEESGFEANVQYRDVKPISAPIYAYNPTPLVRILKK